MPDKQTGEPEALPWGWIMPIPLGVALLFRLMAIGWGLPLKFAHIDESVVIHYALRIASGAVNPDFYDYPGLFIYLLSAVVRVGGGVAGFIKGTGFAVLLDQYVNGNPEFFTLCARGLSTVFDLLTVGLVFQTGRRFANVWTALGAALAVAVNVLHVRTSHYGTADTAACFFFLLGCVRIMEFGRESTVRNAALAGAAVGLGAAAKYYPGVLLVPLSWMVVRKRSLYWQKSLFAAGFATLACFFIGSPFTFLAPGEFLSRFNHLAPKIVGLPETNFIFWPTLEHLWRNAGPLVLLGGVMGLVSALRSPGSWRALGLCWVSLLVFLGLWRTQSPHYGLGLYPPLFLFTIRWVGRVGKSRTWVGVALGGAVMVSLLFPAMNEIRYLQRKDTRLQALEWVRTHLAPGSKLLRFSHTPNFNREDPYIVKVDFEDKRLGWVGGSEGKEAFLRELNDYDYVIMSTFDSPEKDGKYLALESLMTVVERFQGPQPRGVHNPIVTIFKVKGGGAGRVG